MPLAPGSSNAVIHHNVREMVSAGHPVRQAVAAALRSAHYHAQGAHRANGPAIRKANKGAGQLVSPVSFVGKSTFEPPSHLNAQEHGGFAVWPVVPLGI